MNLSHGGANFHISDQGHEDTMWARSGLHLSPDNLPAWQLRRQQRGDDGRPRTARDETAMKEGEEQERVGVDGAASLLWTV